jgi:hypothetical protein
MTRTKNSASDERRRWAAREIAAGSPPAIVAQLCDVSRADLESPDTGDPEFAELVAAYRANFENLPTAPRLAGASQRALRAVEHRLETGELTGIGPVLKELRAHLHPEPPGLPLSPQVAADRQERAFIAALSPGQRAHFAQRSWEAMQHLEDLDPVEGLPPGFDRDEDDLPGEEGEIALNR